MNKLRSKKNVPPAESPKTEETGHDYESGLNRETLCHIQTIIFLIDGIRMSLDSVDVLIMKVRQRSIDTEKKMLYLCRNFP